MMNSICPNCGYVGQSGSLVSTATQREQVLAAHLRCLMNYLLEIICDAEADGYGSREDVDRLLLELIQCETVLEGPPTVEVLNAEFIDA